MHAKQLNIKERHRLDQTKTENKVKKSEDYDLYYYDELDESEKLVARYIVKHSTSIYLSIYLHLVKNDWYY